MASRCTLALCMVFLLTAGLTRANWWGDDANNGGGGDKMRLRDVQSLTLRGGRYTTGRRAAGVPQLVCLSDGGLGREALPQVVQCRNQGIDDRGQVQWRCEADLPKIARFKDIEVVCEGYDRAGDPNILKGSCSLEYTLERVPGTRTSTMTVQDPSGTIAYLHDIPGASCLKDPDFWVSEEKRNTPRADPMPKTKTTKDVGANQVWIPIVVVLSVTALGIAVTLFVMASLRSTHQWSRNIGDHQHLMDMEEWSIWDDDGDSGDEEEEEEGEEEEKKEKEEKEPADPEETTPRPPPESPEAAADGVDDEEPKPKKEKKKKKKRRERHRRSVRVTRGPAPRRSSSSSRAQSDPEAHHHHHYSSPSYPSTTTAHYYSAPPSYAGSSGGGLGFWDGYILGGWGNNSGGRCRDTVTTHNHYSTTPAPAPAPTPPSSSSSWFSSSSPTSSSSSSHTSTAYGGTSSRSGGGGSWGGLFSGSGGGSHRSVGFGGSRTR